MTTVVQNVANQTFTAATTIPISVTSTTAGNLGVIEFGCGSGGAPYTGATVVDNAAGGSSTWASAVTRAGDNRLVVIARCLSLKAGATTVTITPTGGSGGAYGAAAFQQVSGSGTWTEDQKNSGLWQAAQGSLAVTNSTVDTGTTDFVAAVVCTGNGNAAAGITNPPTGYTTAAVQQDDSSSSGVECCYRINASALTDAVTWSCANNQPGDPGALCSFQITASAGAIAGTSALVLGQTGTLTGSGALAGISALAFGQTGALKGAGALAGSSPLVFGQTGTLTQPGLTGSAAIAFGQTGTLTGSGALAGTSALTFNQTGALSAAGALGGSSALALGQTGTLTAAGILAGSSALTFAQTAALAATGALTGTSALVFGASATADVPAGTLQGSAALNLGASGTLTAFGALIGACQILIDASGTLIQPSGVIPGPLDSPRISEGYYRRKKKLRKLGVPVNPVFIAPASFEHAPPQAVIDRVPDFTTLAQTLGEQPALLSARIDREIEVLLREAAERDDEEALVLILTALDDE